MPWLLALPGLVALLAFHFVPIAFGAFYAFTNWDGLSHATWIGLQNFEFFVTDPSLVPAIVNTLLLLGSVIAITVVFGVLIALLVNEPFPGQGIRKVRCFAQSSLDGPPQGRIES